MLPTIVKLGPIHIGSYGLMMALAFLTTAWLLRRELERKGLPGDWAYSVAMAAIVGGIVGARLYFILEYPSDFLRDPLGMIFTGSGLTWYGGLIGGTLAVLWVVHRFPAPVVVVLDLVAPLLLLGYGIGRIGCLLAGDGDYGPPTDMPWGMSFPHGLVPTYEKVHPTPIYETLMAWTLFAILWRWRKKQSVPGRMAAGTFVFYGIERFIAEFWRLTPKVLWGWMSVAQILSVVSMLVGLVVGWYALSHQKRAQRDGYSGWHS